MGQFASSLLPQIILPIEHGDQVGHARREAIRMAQALGFNETLCGNVGVVVTEIASNLARHAIGGELIIRETGWGPTNGLEIISVDQGPGMASVTRSLRDGYSTRGGAGIGLGAVKRLATALDAHSVPGIGTVLVAQFGVEPPSPRRRSFALDVSAISLPLPGETACGDAWAVWQEPNRTVIMVVDGLGHGELAAQAAQEAVQVFQEHPELPPARLIKACHDRMRHTRGAAMAVAEIYHRTHEIWYAGVGNINGRVYTGATSKGMVSYSGTVGHTIRKINEFTYALPPGAVLVMASDGVSNRWEFEDYPGLVVRQPATIAARLCRDFRRTTDDSTVLIARWMGDVP